MVSTEVLSPRFTRGERQKMERRNRIIQAAHSLLQEMNIDAVSAGLIARRAGVSRATVFNLFGTRGEIFACLFERDLEEFEDQVARARSADSLDRIFDAIDIATELYRRDQNYYRVTRRVIPRMPGDSNTFAVSKEPRAHFYRRLLNQALDDRHLRPDADPALLGLLLLHIANGAMSMWISNAIPLDRLRAETGFGFAVALRSFATPAARKRIDLRRKGYEAQLRGLIGWPELPPSGISEK